MDRNPPLPFSKMTVPDWEFHKVLEHGRVPPYWHDKLEVSGRDKQRSFEQSASGLFCD